MTILLSTLPWLPFARKVKAQHDLFTNPDTDPMVLEAIDTSDFRALGQLIRTEAQGLETGAAHFCEAMPAPDQWAGEWLRERAKSMRETAQRLEDMAEQHGLLKAKSLVAALSGPVTSILP